MKTQQKHEESGCPDYLQHTWQSCPENTARHSPLSWEILNGSVFDANGFKVYADQIENAKLIVASVNHADKLAEALRLAFAQSCNRSETNRKWTNADQVAHDKMKAALAAYEEAIAIQKRGAQ